MFFEQLDKYLKGFDFKITLSKKGEKITVGIFPEHKDEDINETLKPISVTGTAAELDAELFNHLSKPLDAVAGIVSNIEGYDKEIKAVEEERKKKLTEKKKESDKKPAAKKPTDKKPVVKKEKAKPAAKKQRVEKTEQSAQVKPEAQQPGSIEF